MKSQIIFDLGTATREAGFGARRAARGIRASINAAGVMGAVMFLFLLAMPARAQAPQAAGGPARISIKSQVLGEDRVILVRTPPGYQANGLRYPVLYMTDGDAHMAHTSGTIEFLARNGRIPELIVVGITNTDRTRDLTPTNATLAGPNGAAIQFPTSGGADKFLKFIETEVIPQIESQYRTQPYRIFAGHSFGGLFAVHTMISRPDLFNAFIAVSPSLPWDNELEIKRAEEFFKARKEWNKTLFVSLGNEPGDISVGFEKFRELLSKSAPKGLDWEVQKMEDEDHGSVVLRSHYFGLRKVFADWQIARDPQTGAVVGGLRAAEEHYKRLSRKLGYEVRVPEALVNQLGYQLMNEGKMEEAIAAFKSNVERYPASANVYDSLAEAYEKSGRLDLAKPNYEKAYNLGKQNNDPNTAVFKANFDRASEKVNSADQAMKKP
ncbi:MAG TPA: alpha/beta hydrolase-fold protein [Blastocatellia bacterium]|jgi:predicted alpha/beta superfamily hydrolase|nr:alpha/beta hydrolase-fold protein [Blastocatellia bacterium]